MTALALRIGRLLRLLLGSDKAGEIIATVAALKRTLHSAGLDHHQLAAAVEVGLAAPAETTTEQAAADWRSTAWFCWHRRNQLAEKERAFIEALVRWRGAPSEAQLRWLGDIAEGLRRDGWRR